MYSQLILQSRTIVGLVGNANSGHIKCSPVAFCQTMSDCSDHHIGNFSDNCDHGGKLKTFCGSSVYDEAGLFEF